MNNTNLSRVVPSGDQLILGAQVLGTKEGGWQTGDVVALSRELLKQGHMHVRGRTRSGKTSLTLLPLALRLMEEYELVWQDRWQKEHRRRERDALFIFDLGGDQALFNAVKNRAEALGRTFRFLSLDPKRSYYFDPFQSVTVDEFRVIRICNLLVEAFHLDHGLVYGGAYYTQRALSALLRVAERAFESRRSGGNTGLKDIADYLELHREKDEDAVRMTFQFLLRYEQLMPAPEDPMVIDVARAIEEREVIYFFTPTMGEATTARQIAGLGLYTVVNAAMQLVAKRAAAEWESPLPHAFVLVDEFHEIAGRSFAALLAQASKFGLSLVMSNQTTQQLESRDLSLADIVRDNTLCKVYFTITGQKDLEELQLFSREERDRLRSHSAAAGGLLEHGLYGGERSGSSEFVVPALRHNTILDTSATFGHFFAVIDDGRGHQDPQRCAAKHLLPLAEYRVLRATPLPEVAHASKPAVSTEPVELLWQRARRSPPTPERRARLDQLTLLLKTKRCQETGEDGESQQSD